MKKKKSSSSSDATVCSCSVRSDGSVCKCMGKWGFLHLRLPKHKFIIHINWYSCFSGKTPAPSEVSNPFNFTTYLKLQTSSYLLYNQFQDFHSKNLYVCLHVFLVISLSNHSSMSFYKRNIKAFLVKVVTACNS